MQCVSSYNMHQLACVFRQALHVVAAMRAVFSNCEPMLFFDCFRTSCCSRGVAQEIICNPPKLHVLCVILTIGLPLAGGGSDDDEEEEGDEPLLAIEKRAKILDRKR